LAAHADEPHRGRERRGLKTGKEIPMSNDTTKNRPAYRLFQEIVDDTGKSAREPIGALWPHSKGGGFNLKLTKQPAAGAKLVVFPVREKTGGAS
jgi:hypothetical protein